MASLLKKLQRQRDEAGKPTREELESVNSEEDDQLADQQPAEDEPQSDQEKGEAAAAEVDSEDELRAFKDPDPASKDWKNRQRTLVVSSRGLVSRSRILINDICDMVPNTKRESKVNRKEAVEVIDDIAYERSCNNVMFFEQRKHKDLYVWMSKSPSGPSAKFHITNINTTEELKLTGNCLKFSRPLLSFDNGFDETPQLRLTKELLCQVFGTPKNHPKSKPFIDHVLSFKLHDNRVWFRAYQILNQHEEKFTAKDDIEKLVLIEIGPRMTLQPIKVFDGSLGGRALWQNSGFIGPNKQRGKRMEDYIKKRDDKAVRKSNLKKLQKEGQDEDSYLEDAYE